MREGSLDAPTRHSIDWQNPEFYDEAKLDAELRRVFDICNGCRRCFNLCDSFPRLFDLIDQTDSGEIADVPSAAFKSVSDACTLCDMCYMTKCPYVPPHEFNLDFPHLMVRARAVEQKKGETKFADRELAKTDRNGELAKYAAGVVNWATSRENGSMRGVLQKFAGVDPNAELPRYTSKPFVDRRADDIAVNEEAPAFGKRKAVLYATCFTNYNDPEFGVVARKLLARNGVETKVAYPACCGMPLLEQGNLEQVAANAKKVARALRDDIARGYDIVALVPSCALMLKLEWPLIVPKDDPDYGLIETLATATFDLSEYIVDVAKKQGLIKEMKPLAGDVALHLACHARAQNMGAKAAEMMRLLPAAENISVIERCSGHGGAWGVKAPNFQTALKVGKPVARKAVELVKAAREAGRAAFVASECPLAATHIAQGVESLEGAGAPAARALNPVEIFAMSFDIFREDVR